MATSAGIRSIDFLSRSWLVLWRGASDDFAGAKEERSNAEAWPGLAEGKTTSVVFQLRWQNYRRGDDNGPKGPFAVQASEENQCR